MSRSHVVRMRLSPLGFLLVLMLAALACSESDGSGPASDPLAGLIRVENGDSAGPPPNPGQGEGRIVGRVRGYEIGQNHDTVGTDVPLPGVQVTAYVRLGSGGDVTVGEKKAETTTDAEGEFALPPLPAGEYVLTFVPPATLPYRAGWTVGSAWSGSEQSPWTIMLRKL